VAQIDPSTDIGRLRLRVADVGDLPYLPDSVYTQTLADNAGNLPASAKQIAMYILGILSFKTDRKMGLQLQVWGSQAATAYKDFLLLSYTNPNFMDISPIPYDNTGTLPHPLIEFQKLWNLNFVDITVTERMRWDAIGSPNVGAPYNWDADFELTGQ